MNANLRSFYLLANNIPWRCRILFMFVLFAAAQLIVLSPSGAAQPEPDWFSNNDGKPIFHFRVEVFDPDGSPASGCTVVSRARDSELQVTEQSGIFRIDLCPAEFENLHSFRIVANSSDETMMADELVTSDRVRQLARDGIQMHLKPARTVEVSVFHENNPVQAANVQIWSVGIYPAVKTDANGLARFNLPFDAELFKILAWKDNRLIGGMEPRQMPGSFGRSNEFRVDLERCKDLKINVRDSNGDPIKNVPLDVRIRTMPPDSQSFPFEHLGRVVTDENGETTFKWMPRNAAAHRFYAFPDSGDWYLLDSEKVNDGEYLVKLAPRVRHPRQKIAGKLNLPPGEPGGFFLTLSTFQGEQENMSDLQSCFVDRHGNYELEVLHGATYAAYVNDVNWGSTVWDGIVFEPESNSIQLPDIEFERNVPVEIVATQGPNRDPIPNLGINMANRHRYSWEEEGQKESGTKERRWLARTNEAGVAMTQSTPGLIRASIYSPDWRTEQDTETRPGETTRIEFHRSTAGSQPISGSVAFANGDTGIVDNAKIVAFAADGESTGKSEATSDSSGAFELELPGTEIAYLILSEDGKYSAAGITPTSKELRAKLHPCVSYKGRVVNKDNQPFADCTVVAEAIISFQRGEMGLPSSFSVKEFHTKTDADGRFEFLDCLPTGIRLNCSAITSDNQTHRLETIIFEPGEDREFRLLTIDDSVRKRIDDFPLSHIFATRVNDAQLINAHVLVVIHQKGREIENFIESNCFNYDENKDVGRFLTIEINESRTETKVDGDFLSERNWSIPGENEFIMLAIGPTGNELGRRKISVSEENADGKVASFLAGHLPVQKDAKAEFQKALAEAKRTDRKIWARICQTRCGPCFLLSRWIDKNREQLEKEFVLFKVDNVNETNGMEVFRLIMPEEGNHGVPFHAVFDADGNKLIDSRNALGNIGYPNSSYESKKHLKKMLSTDLMHLKPEEIQLLVDSLE